MNAAPESARDAVRRLFDEELRSGYSIAGCHRHNRADGTELYQAVRLKHAEQEKIIRPIRRKGARYSFGRGDRPAAGWPLYHPPYPLVETDPLFFVEGEGCADALANLGLTAITSGGASSAGSADLTQIRGRNVTIWPDNDEPGRKHAEEVAAVLRKLDCAVEVIGIDALGLSGEGDDCVDWLKLHPTATKDDVLALVTMPEPVNIVDDAIARIKKDPGAIFQDNVAAEIRRLEKEDMPAFVRTRDAVKASGRVKMADFDAHCRASIGAQSDDDGGMFPEVERWQEPVVGDVLLDDLCTTIRRFVVADDSTVWAAALWIVMTWLIDVITVAPIANVTAPEKRCGKTVLLTLFGLLCYRALQVSNISSPAMFRAIEKWTPTLLIDEVDSFLRENEEARGLLNSGHTRSSAFVIRCEGDDHEPTRFSTWAAKALCGIGHIADTLADRSIPLKLRRKRQDERTENVRRIDPEHCESLRSRIARWIDDHRDGVAHARPGSIDGLHDRANDCWEPLLAIADAAGGDWPKRARDAAKALHGADSDTPSSGVELLADIRQIFKDKKVSRLFTTDLLDALFGVDEGPWATWNRGKPMAARQLSKRLKEFDIKPGQVRIGDKNRNGYELADFTDIFTRYLPAGGILSSTPLQTSVYAGCSEFLSSTNLNHVEDENLRKASNGGGCRVVEDNPPLPSAVEGFDI